jgi:DNA repair protein RecO (recombination protein O)
VHIEYFEKATSSMVRIENADLDQSNSGLEKSLRKICTASFFTEFVDKLTKEKQKNEHLFQILKVILHNLKHVEFTITDILYYELQMLGFLGYMPNLATCVQCGKELPDAEKLYFSRERGGTVCLGCSRSLPHRQYPLGFISHMSLLDSMGPAKSSAGFERLGRQILEDFVGFHLAVELKSYRLLKSITG